MSPIGYWHSVCRSYRDLWQRRDAFRLTDMRDRETIDSELRLIALRRQSIREQGGQPSCQQADELLDERLGHRAEAPEAKAVCYHTDDVTPRGRKGVLRRFGPLAALPLSLLAVATAFVTMFRGYQQHTPDSA